MLENLNKEQLEAVTTTEGPLLVLAGAGSGKTKVLTTRVAYLIDELGITPESILAITFTNKAAKEMKDRIFKMLGTIAYQIQISTFHSFGLTILKEHYEKLGYDKNFTILDSDDSSTVVKKILKDMDKDPKKYDDAVKYDTLTFTKVLNDQLNVMDMTAATMCRDNKLPILVFDMADGNIVRAVKGETIGTLVQE